MPGKPSRTTETVSFVSNSHSKTAEGLRLAVQPGVRQRAAVETSDNIDGGTQAAIHVDTTTTAKSLEGIA